MAAFLFADSPPALRALAETPTWFEEWEQALSRFRPDSDLSRFNALAGQPYQAGPTLWAVAHAAQEAARWTAGLVDPTILRSLEFSGYDHTFEALGNFSSPPPVSAAFAHRAPSLPNWRRLRLDERNGCITLPESLGLDLGGIAKGWAAHQAMRRLSDFGPALVDAGGDIAISDAQPGGRPWPVAVVDPTHPDATAATLFLRDCGVATSGIDYRRWQQDGQWKHHIIDPRTGLPAETDLLSVTVIAPDVRKAEAAAKAVLILGSQDGMRWLDDHPQLSALMILQDGSQRASPSFRSYTQD